MVNKKSNGTTISYYIDIYIYISKLACTETYLHSSNPTHDEPEKSIYYIVACTLYMLEDNVSENCFIS